MQYTLNYFMNCGDLLESLHSYFVQRKFVSIKKKNNAVRYNEWY